jgi:hypothetical protein
MACDGSFGSSRGPVISAIPFKDMDDARAFLLAPMRTASPITSPC